MQTGWPMSIELTKLGIVPETTPLNKPMGEIYFLDGTPGRDAAIVDTCRRGYLQKIATTIFTNVMDEPVEDVALRNWPLILNFLHPGALITGRSAYDWRPVASSYNRSPPDSYPTLYLITQDGLPKAAKGLNFEVRKGIGPVEGDIPYLGGWIIGPDRAWLENMRGGNSRSGVGQTELARRLEAIFREEGGGALEAIFERTALIAPLVDKVQAHDKLRLLIDRIYENDRIARQTLANLMSFDPAETDRSDADTVARLSLLADYLSRRAPLRLHWTARGTSQGNTCEYDMLVAMARPDGEKVKVSDRGWQDRMRKLSLPQGRPSSLSFEEFLGFLHAVGDRLLSVRQSAGDRKGWSSEPAGFDVPPEDADEPPPHVDTLRRGFEKSLTIADPFHRALYLFAIVWLCAPYGRLNRPIAALTMNTETDAFGLVRTCFPPVVLPDIEREMARFEADGDPVGLALAVAFCHRVSDAVRTAAGRTTMHEQDLWATTYAFCAPGTALFGMPDPEEPVARRDRIPAPLSHWERLGISAGPGVPVVAGSTK